MDIHAVPSPCHIYGSEDMIVHIDCPAAKRINFPVFPYYPDCASVGKEPEFYTSCFICTESI
jgi:hypothetical protein